MSRSRVLCTGSDRRNIEEFEFHLAVSGDWNQGKNLGVVFDRVKEYKLVETPVLYHGK